MVMETRSRRHALQQQPQQKQEKSIHDSNENALALSRKNNNSGKEITPSLKYACNKGRSEKENLLEEIYTNPKSPACYTNVEQVYAAAQKHNVGQKIDRNSVSRFLQSRPEYTRHRKIIRRFPRLPTIAAGFHTDWHCDLADFQRICGSNNGYRYLLVCIDCLSRQLFVEPLLRKSAVIMEQAFKKIFDRSKYVPWRIYTDQGLEFRNDCVQKLFSHFGIAHRIMITSPKFHASMAERAIQTVKGRLWRYFTHRRTHRWLDVIQTLVTAINNSPHSALPGGMSPSNVTCKNAQQVRRQLWSKAGIQAEVTKACEFAAVKFPKYGNSRYKILRVGDRVRIENTKHVFEKGYLPRFSGEIFRIARVRCGDLRIAPTLPVTYRLVADADGTPVPSWFYKNELSIVLP